jgi:hypothetical protein
MLFKITWEALYFLLFLIPFANFVLGIMTSIKLAQAFGKARLGVPAHFPEYRLPLHYAFDKSIVYVGGAGKSAAYVRIGRRYQYPNRRLSETYQQGYQNTYQQGYQNPYQNSGQHGYPAHRWQQNAQNAGYGGYQQTPPPQGGMMFCPACGARLAAGSRFCTQCGKEFQ